MPDVLTKLRRRARVGVLLDALADEAFCRSVVAAMGENTGLALGRKIHFSGTDVFGELVGDEPVEELSEARRGGADQQLGDTGRTADPEGLPAPPEG